MVMGIANLAMATGNIGREGVGVNPLRGQNNVQGSCDMGSFPHELAATATSPTTTVRAQFEALWGRTLDPSPACASRTCSTPRSGVPRHLHPGRGHRQSDPNTAHVQAGARWSASSCRTCS